MGYLVGVFEATDRSRASLRVRWPLHCYLPRVAPSKHVADKGRLWPFQQQQELCDVINTFNSFKGERIIALSVLAAAVVLVSACGDSGKKDKANSQTAVKVNKEELTVHQINYVLQQQRGLKPEQMDGASRQVLEKLIDQELALQKAEEQKLDRDPKVVQQLQAAKREIIARAYAEKIGDAASKPTPDEVRKYYEQNPALFKERRVYSIQELFVDAKPEEMDKIRADLQKSKNISEFVEMLKAAGVRFTGNQAVRAAEQLPLGMLTGFAALKDGQAMFNATASGAQVIFLAGSRSEPVDEARAKPAIEAYLGNDAKRKLIDSEIKALRSAAKIEYVGKFAQPAASAPAASVTAPAVAASGVDTNGLTKGLSGLK
jgi:EpsD family peptidyl-prolyl cis-trans isomerase